MDFANIYPIAILLVVILIIVLGMKFFKIAKKVVWGIIIIGLLAVLLLYFAI